MSANVSQSFNQDSLGNGNIGIAGTVLTTTPTYTNGQTVPLRVNGSGAQVVDGSGVTQPVSAATLPLPTGASTAALQTTGNTSLASLTAQLPATLGAKTSANSLAVVLATDETVPVSATTLPLPTGAATAALQTTQEATLTAISGQLPATLGQKTSANSLAVVLASDETIPVTMARGTTPTLTNVASSATSVTLLAANVNRKSLKIFNDPGVTLGGQLFIAYGSSASATGFSDKIFPNASYNDDNYTGAVSGIWNTALGTARVTEVV